MTWRWPCLPCLTVALLLGCGHSRDDTSMPSSVFDDSAVPIWTADAQPVFTIGGADERDGYFFERIRGAVIVSDRLVVADAGAFEVRFYDLQGELQARAGSSGSGPGEFRGIRGLSSVGDTAVVVWDAQLARATFLSASGTLIRTVAPNVGLARNVRPAFIGAMPDGSLVFRDGMPDMHLESAATGQRRDSIQILVESAGGRERHMWSRGSETWFVNEGSSWGSSPVMFGRSTFQAIAGNRLVIAWTDSLELEGYSTNLTRRAAQVLRWTTRSVSPEEIEAMRRALVKETDQEAESRRSSGMAINGRSIGDVMLPFALRQIESLPARATEPAFADLRGDPMARVWVAQFAHKGSGDRWWLALDSTFAPTGRIRVDADLMVLDISLRGLVVVTRDELDRELLAVYRIRR